MLLSPNSKDYVCNVQDKVIDIRFQTCYGSRNKICLVRCMEPKVQQAS